MTEDTKLQRLLQMLRWCGAAMIVTAAGTFLVQSWNDTGDVTRYLALLGATALIPAVGYLCGIRFQEARSARVLVLTFLALLPVHAGLLGGFVLSQLGDVSTSVAPVAQWVAPSKTAALLLVAGSATLLMPLAWASFRILARPHAGMLTAASAAAHALMLVPSRSALAAMLTVLPIVGLTVWSAKRIHPQTREAKLAIASLTAPAVVIAARQVLFYDVTLAFWAAVLGAASAAMVAFGRKNGDPSIERVAIVPLALGVGALWGDIVDRFDVSFTDAWLSYGWATGAVLVGLAVTSRSSKRFFSLTAMALNAFTAVTLLVVSDSPWAALQLIALGLGFVSYGFISGRRFATYAGGSLALVGFAREVAFAIDHFEAGGWLALGGLGVTLVGLTAWLERRARAVRLAEGPAKVSRPARAPLPSWQRNDAPTVAECTKS